MKVYPDGRERCETDDEWKARRRECWLRDEKMCVQCGKRLPLRGGPYRAANIDHIIPRSVERDDRLSNLRTLCFDCHRQRDL